MAAAIIQARVLVDWNNVQARVLPDFNLNPRKNIPKLTLSIQQQVAKVLGKAGSSAKFRAGMRIYYGWHQERVATPVRRDFEQFQFDKNFARRFGNVSFVRGFEFGNELCCYDDSTPLFDTYRGKGQEEGQKMVDTAITCDLLHLNRFNPAMVCVIVSDDDDFVPALITSTRWRAQSYLLRVKVRNLRLVTDDAIDDNIHYWSES